MPFGDGTGPAGGGFGTGREIKQSGGRGRQPGGFGLGPSGNCVCPKCGKKVPHQRGIPCYEQKCPECNIPLTREK